MGRAKVPVSSVQPVPYWETLFPALDGVDLGYGFGPASATQNVFQLFEQNRYNETYALFELDAPDSLSGAGVNPNGTYPSFRFYHDQYSALYGVALDWVFELSRAAGGLSPAVWIGAAGGFQLHAVEIDGYYVAGGASEQFGGNELRADYEYLEPEPALRRFRLRRAAPDQRELYMGSAGWAREAVLVQRKQIDRSGDWRVADDGHRALDERLSFHYEQWRVLSDELGHPGICDADCADSIAGCQARAPDAALCRSSCGIFGV